jgi:cytoskeleton protein RodZ
VGSFGDKLKREREMRAITLEEIADATKIGTRSLRALEEEHFDQLPGGIFNKGFVRAYAKFLGIDEEQAVSDYITASGEVGNTTATQMAALADQVEQQRAARQASEASLDTGKMLAVIVMLVVICGLGFGGYKAWKFRNHQIEMRAAAAARSKQDSAQVAAVSNTPSSTDIDTSSAAPITSPTTDVTGPAPANAAPATTTPASSKEAAVDPTKTTATSAEFPINVTLKPLKSSWIMVTSDGKVIYQRIITPKDQELTLHGKDKLQLILGNAAGVEVSFNGKTLGALGPEGQRRELTITPNGLER